MAPRKTTAAESSDSTKQTAKTQGTARSTRRSSRIKDLKKRETSPAADQPTPRKRKRTAVKNESASPEPPAKKHSSQGNQSQKEQSTILINRAPVLELWSACVAHFTHPDLAWSTCLSIGSTIASITAISKGRSIGVLSPPDDVKDKRKKRDRGDGDEIKVMGFRMHIRDGAVVFKGKPKPGKEDSLVRRFGGEDCLQRTRKVMESALEKSWKGKEDELEKKAFSLYEKFRPSVAAGQRGWGRKGELVLDKVEDTICG
ncbi:putative ribosomal protein s5 protein [Echria macrotheca]|uniref:Ribosomal protein s5 protein n=1 Tax=Echria macrotheca TaxID=438768 RepID=A0AAJ0F6B3_9PEZI|nr:putative ribosomal protein s5 protein [Echria macrotheca]